MSIFLEKVDHTIIEEYEKMHLDKQNPIFYTASGSIRKKAFDDFLENRIPMPKTPTSPDLNDLMFIDTGPASKYKPSTRIATQTRLLKGVSFCCYAVQFYIMLRLALISLIPKQSIHFSTIEHKLFKIFSANITSDRFNPTIFKGQTEVETINEYFIRNSLDSVLFGNMRGLSKIIKLQVFENITIHESATEPRDSRAIKNDNYNSISLRNVETPGASEQYSGITSRREYIQFLIEKSESIPIPISFGYKYDNDDLKPLAIDHWFVLWRGKIRTAWGDNAFGFNYYTSPPISVDFFCDVLAFLDSIDPLGEIVERGKPIFRRFLNEYMGIKPENTHIYETYKGHFPKLPKETDHEHETRLKVQSSTELIEAYINTHTDIYFEEGETTGVTENTPARLKSAKQHGYGGYDLFELKPETRVQYVNEEYYILLQQCIRTIAELEIVEHLDRRILYRDLPASLPANLSGKIAKKATRIISKACAGVGNCDSIDEGICEEKTEVVSIGAADTNFIVKSKTYHKVGQRKGGSRKTTKYKLNCKSRKNK